MREDDDDGADLPVLARAPLGCMQFVIGTASGLALLALSVSLWVLFAQAGFGLFASLLGLSLCAGSFVGGIATARAVRRFQTRRLVHVDAAVPVLESGAGPSTPTATRALQGRTGEDHVAKAARAAQERARAKANLP